MSFLKYLINKLIDVIVFIFGAVFSYRFFRRLNIYFDQAYSLTVKKIFKSCQKGFLVERPIYVYGEKYISIGKDFRSGPGFRIEALDEYRGQKFSPSIEIGDNVVFHDNCHVGCINKISIGNEVLFASRVFITDHFHGDITANDKTNAPADRPLSSKGPVIIKDRVWVGEGVVILPGVTIGENAIIGANAVVNKDVPANSVVVGNPARLIKSI